MEYLYESFFKNNSMLSTIFSSFCFALIHLVNLSPAAADQALIIGCYPGEYTIENGRGIIKENPNWHYLDRHEPSSRILMQVPQSNFW